MNVTTVMLPLYMDRRRVAVTERLLTGESAYAVQISATPACVLDRATRDHESPPPDTARNHCEYGMSGPSLVRNATSSSPWEEVENGGDAKVAAETLPMSAEMVRSTASEVVAAPLRVVNATMPINAVRVTSTSTLNERERVSIVVVLDTRPLPCLHTAAYAALSEASRW